MSTHRAISTRRPTGTQLAGAILAAGALLLAAPAATASAAGGDPTGGGGGPTGGGTAGNPVSAVGSFVSGVQQQVGTAGTRALVQTGTAGTHALTQLGQAGNGFLIGVGQLLGSFQTNTGSPPPGDGGGVGGGGGSAAQWLLKWAPAGDGDTALLAADCSTGRVNIGARAITDHTTWTVRPLSLGQTTESLRTTLRSGGLIDASTLTFCPPRRMAGWPVDRYQRFG
jgi:hypothetical protein